MERPALRHIFERYCALGSIAALADELADEGYRTKIRTFKTGGQVGGVTFGKGALGHMLKNPIVVGRLNDIIPPAIAAQLSVDQLEVTHADRGQATTVLIGATVPLKRETILALNARIELHQGKIIITIDEMTGDATHQARIDVAYSDQRSSHAKLISIAAGEASSRPDSTLVKLMAQAHAAQRMLLSGKPEPPVAHFSKRHLSRLYHLSWLAPDIVAAIMGGRQPRQLNARRLLRMNGIPIEWGAQRIMFGFA